MELLANKLTDCCLRAKLIEENQSDWCRYALQMRITNVGGFLILMVFGLFLASWPQVILLNLGVAFLRKKTNGLHMATVGGCFSFSLLCEYGCLVAIKFMQPLIALALFICATITILVLAPCNNKEIHYTEKEKKCLREAVHRRIVEYTLIVIVLFTIEPVFSYILIMAESSVALLVVLAKRGFGIQ